MFLFAASFVPLTTLDLLVTWIGFQYFNTPDRRCCPESNPLTDLSSIPAYVGPEVVVLVIGMAMVAVGGWLKARALVRNRESFANLRNLPFRKFAGRYDAVGGGVSTIIIAIPMVIAIGRIYPVVNNTIWLIIDWGPSLLFRFRLDNVLACLFALFPMYYLIYRTTLVDNETPV